MADNSKVLWNANQNKCLPFQLGCLCVHLCVFVFVAFVIRTSKTKTLFGFIMYRAVGDKSHMCVDVSFLYAPGLHIYVIVAY